MIKLLAIDLDDTLLDDKLEISQKNREALAYAHGKGVHIVLCSGRPLKGMLHYTEQLAFANGEDYIISFNGAMVNKLNGELVHKYTIQPEEIRILTEIGDKYGIDVQMYDDETFIIRKETPYSREYARHVSLEPIIVENYNILEYSIKTLFNYEQGDKLENLRLEVISRLGSKLNAFYSKPHFVEVLNGSASKGLAVAKLAEMLGIGREEVMAIGDSFNDQSMIEYAGCGVAVANAKEDIKKTASYTTKNTNNQDAVAEAVWKFI